MPQALALTSDLALGSGLDGENPDWPRFLTQLISTAGLEPLIFTPGVAVHGCLSSCPRILAAAAPPPTRDAPRVFTPGGQGCPFWLPSPGALSLD